MRLLVLEDDTFIAEEIKLYFEHKGHEVTCYEEGESLLDCPSLNAFDMFLFDINMPIKDGIETLKEIRSLGINTPTIFLTSMSDIDYVKRGYQVGCNDYVRKPFHFEELELRISQLLGNPSCQPIKLSSEHTFDLNARELCEDNKPMVLSDNEKNLIYMLARNLGHIVDSDTLMEYIWEDKNVTQNTLRTQIKKLRGKLSQDFIINVRGYGYKIESL